MAWKYPLLFVCLIFHSGLVFILEDGGMVDDNRGYEDGHFTTMVVSLNCDS